MFNLLKDFTHGSLIICIVIAIYLLIYLIKEGIKLMKYVQLDPRNTKEAIAANNVIFSSSPVLGIEITIPELAKRCDLIIDHYINQGIHMSAIDVAFVLMNIKDMNEDLLTIAILKPDCDTIGAAACLEIRFGANKNLVDIKEITFERVRLISKFDRFEFDRFNKDWIWQPHTLPSRENPWPSTGGLKSSLELAALQAMCGDHTIPLSERVYHMENWLKGGDLILSQYTEMVQKERLNLISAIESGEIKYHCLSKEKSQAVQDGFDDHEPICIIETTHRAATMIGYCLAPIIVAVNPEFRFKSDIEPVRKITICSWSSKYCDIPKVAKALNEIEPGWGGHGNICGSPQGISSSLSIDKIVEILQQNIL